MGQEASDSDSSEKCGSGGLRLRGGKAENCVKTLFIDPLGHHAVKRIHMPTHMKDGIVKKSGGCLEGASIRS